MTKSKINVNDSSVWESLDWDEPVVPEKLKKTDSNVNRGRANRLKAESPEWKKKQKEGIVEKTNSEEWKKKQKSGVKKRDINWKNNITESHANLRTTETYKQQRKEVGQKLKGTEYFSNAVKEGVKDRWEKEENLSTCPHCKKVVDNANYKRWHGNNCKHKVL